MRNHERIIAFQRADALAIAIYQETKRFPKDEICGLRAQIRRAAVSTVCNIVEGAARYSDADYLRFLDISLGSANEVAYQLSLAYRLGYLPKGSYQPLKDLSSETCRLLVGLVGAIRRKVPR